MRIARRQVRPIEVLRAAWGTALLVAPRAVMTDVHHVTVDTRSLVVARVLGARQVTQAVLSGVSPSPEVLATGVWVDTAHAATAVGLALADRSRARAGLTDAAVAAAWALAGLFDLTHGLVPPARHERRRDRLARWTLRRLPGGRPLARLARDRRRSTRLTHP